MNACGWNSNACPERRRASLPRESLPLSLLVIVKTLLVFAHLLAMAVAVGRILLFDLQFLRLLHAPPSLAWRQDLEALKTTVKAALAVLWVTGAALVYMATLQDPAALQNQKLWMKVLTVALLTANGYLMHRFALPALNENLAFLARPGRQVVLLTVFAVTSTVTWLFASFLGIARPWNHTVGIGMLLALYATLMATALVGSLSWMFALRALPQRAADKTSALRVEPEPAEQPVQHSPGASIAMAPRPGPRSRALETTRNG